MFYRYFKGWVKPDGSFSEAGANWPWSCSVELCYKIYAPSSIEILRGVGHTTLGTTAATSSLYETTPEPDILLEDYDFETSPVPPLVFETTPDASFSFETTPVPKFDLLVQSTAAVFDLFETTPAQGILFFFVKMDFSGRNRRL